MSESKKYVVGIDLGTGYSCVGVMEAGKPKVQENAEGKRTTPSVVQIKNGERKVGDAAKRSAIMEPKNTVSFIKRLMGAEFNDPDVQQMLNRVEYEIVKKKNKPYVKIDGQEYSPEEISSMILTKMADVAEAYYGHRPEAAVITCPAWFNDVQRNATKMAGELAGLEVLRIINEPTAAVLASDININTDKKVMVTDIGCGTTDFSVVDISDGTVEVLASDGDVFLGGADYDNAIVDWIANEFMGDNPGIDLRKDSMAHSRLLEAAEKAKIELSGVMETEINLPYITADATGPKHFVKTLTRAKFDQLTNDLNTRVIDIAGRALEKSGLSVDELDEILLVGGSTRIPAIREALTNKFGVKLNSSVNPDEAVALGATIQANILNGGASDDDMLLLDVTPISLGIEVNGNEMSKLIEANTTIPTKKSETYTTAVDNQPAVTIKVLQGERPLSADNKLIGEFTLDGIAPARRGVPQIEVTFDIDANGILSVTAKDKATGKEQNVTIKNDSLTPEEIEKIKADAEANKEADAKRMEEIGKLHQAEQIMYGVENSLTDEKFVDKYTEEEKTKINELLEPLKKAIEDKDLDTVESAQKELMEYYNPIIERIYKETQPTEEGQNAPDAPNPFANMDDTPFSEFTEEKKD